jgi:hypothetical protein
MKLGTRSRVALAAVALSSGALLAPAAPAAASSPCVPDHCDLLYIYYSDASLTHEVGESAHGFCGDIEQGVHTEYYRVIRRTC